MSEVRAGRGLMAFDRSIMLEGQEIKISEISIDKIDVNMIDTMMAQPGDILTYEMYGHVKWKKPETPFNGDEELRRHYPALEEAWGKLMDSFGEYQMVKKLVQDHN